MSKIVEFYISLINLYSLVTYKVIVFFIFQNDDGGHLKKRPFKKNYRQFYEVHGSYIFSKGFYLTDKSRNKGKKKMVTELTKMTLLYT